MITLEMPEDVRQHVLDFQGKRKAKKGLGQYSQQQAIIDMLREHKIFSDQLPPIDKHENEGQEP
jgi:hypothetical protein